MYKILFNNISDYENNSSYNRIVKLIDEYKFEKFYFISLSIDDKVLSGEIIYTTMATSKNEAYQNFLTNEILSTLIENEYIESQLNVSISDLYSFYKDNIISFMDDIKKTWDNDIKYVGVSELDDLFMVYQHFDVISSNHLLNDEISDNRNIINDSNDEEKEQV